MADAQDYKYDLFISYNRADEKWAEQLAVRLEREDHRGHNLKVFFAPWEIRPGESVEERLDRALAESRYVGLILSPESVESQWVKEEWYSTHHINVKRKERRLIPLYLRTCDIPPLLSHLHRIDFRNEDEFDYGIRLLLAVIREEPLPRGELQISSESPSAPPLIDPKMRIKLQGLEQLAQENVIDQNEKQEYRRKILDKWIETD
jgi:hypothetical protein